MRTQYVATIPLDGPRLEKDLEQSQSFRYSEAYSDYLIGGPWKSCMLWAKGGEAGDGYIHRYRYGEEATFTEYGKQVPYLQELICQTVDTSRLTFVRLGVFADSTIVPHRDYLEFAGRTEQDRPAHRMHIPLRTYDNVYFVEEDTVYQMRTGEIWYLDVAREHAVTSFNKAPRIHLIFDFVDRPEDGPLVKVPDTGPGPGIPADHTIARPPLPDAERVELMRLANLLTMDTFDDIFNIVIKKNLRFDGGPGFVWKTIIELAGASKDPAVLPHAQELRRYYMLDGKELDQK